VGDEHTEANTETYIPTVTELQTDLDATPISSPSPRATEPALEEVPAPAQPAAQPPPAASLAPPAPPLEPGARHGPDPPEQPRPAALAPSSAGEPTVETGELRGDPFPHEPEPYRRASPGLQSTSSQIGRGERLGIAIAATFLVLTVLAIAAFQFNSPSSDEDSGTSSPPASDSSTLTGGVAIAEEPGKRPADGAAVDVTAAQNYGGEEEIQITAKGSVPDSEAEAPQAPDGPRESVEEVIAEMAAASVAAAKPGTTPKPVVARQAEPVAPSSKDDIEEKSDSNPDVPAEPGMITVSSYPWSEVYIDDIKVGVIPLQEHELAAGIHTIRLVFPSVDNREISEKIEVRPGKHLRIVRKLKPATEN